MIKQHKNIRHLNDLVIGAITHGNYANFVHYISIYPKDILEKKKKSSYNDNFLYYSLIRSKLDISKYLKDIGFETSITYVLHDTKIDDIESVYKTLIELNYDVSLVSKQNLIIRILDHTKLEANKNRVDVFFKYVDSGFFTSEDVKNAIEYLIKQDKVKHVAIKGVIREYQLNKLLS